MTGEPLRRLRAEDAAAVLDAFLSAPDMARQGEVTTAAEAEAYVSRLIDPAGPHRAFAIDVDGVLAGLVAVSIDAVNRNGWFWYWMHAAHRGRGLTSAAARAVADWALGEDGGLERLELGHRVDNPGSEAVARAAGFVPEGREREKFLIAGERVDVLTYGRLRSDP